MNDDFDDFEQRLARHVMPGPSDELGRRIAALPGRVRPHVPWLGIAAALLAVLSLAQIIISTPRFPSPHQQLPSPAALDAGIRQLNLPLTDQQTRQLADTLAVGARLQLQPEIHGQPISAPLPGDIP